MNNEQTTHSVEEVFESNPMVDAVINLLITYTDCYCAENAFDYYIEGEESEDGVKKWIDKLIDEHQLDMLITGTHPSSAYSQQLLMIEFENRKYKDVLKYLDQKKAELEAQNSIENQL